MLQNQILGENGMLFWGYFELSRQRRYIVLLQINQWFYGAIRSIVGIGSYGQKK